MKTKKELLDIFFNNESYLDWERYDFVDPPYCWSVMASFEIDGYSFNVDGVETVNCGYETNYVDVTTPDGEKIILIDNM